MLVESICALPEEQQKAITWLIANYDTAAAICKAKTLTENESCKVINHALQKNDDYLFLSPF